MLVFTSSHSCYAPHGIEPVGRSHIGGELRTCLGHEFAEIATGPGDAALYRAEIYAEGAGNLVVRAVQKVPQREDFPLTWHELLHARRDDDDKFIDAGLTRGIGFLRGHKVIERSV